MSTAISQLIEAEGLPAEYRAIVDAHWRPLSEDIAERALDKPLVVGINGAQGAGKSTLCRFSKCCWSSTTSARPRFRSTTSI